MIGAQTLHATGYAMGIQRDGDVGTGDPDRDAAVLAYFGDGATAQGDVNESFVFASVFNAPVVFFCQNNQWAISVPNERQTRVPLYQRASGFGFPGVRVDGNDVLAVYAVTKAALDRARGGEGPTFIEAFTYRMGAHTTSDDPTRYRIAAEVEEWKLKDPIARLKVHLARGGMADEAFFASVERQADELAARLREQCLAMPDPQPLTHVRPRLPRGARAAGPGTGLVRRLPPIVRAEPRGAVMDQPAGRPAAPSTTTIAKAINAGLRRAMEDDPKVLVMGEDVGKLGGVFRITDELQKDFGEDRVIDTPLAESGIIGTAIGLALRGYRPICEIQFDGFIYPAYDQIVSQLAKMPYRSAGSIKLPVVVRVPFGGGIGAVEHHSESPEGYFAHTAGLRVVSCATPTDAYWMIQQAVRSDDPVLFFEPKRRYWEKGELDLSGPPAPLHAARVLRPGTDVTVAAYGPMVRTALDAAAAAQEEDKSLEVLDLRSLSPLDVDALIASVQRTRRLVVVHEAPSYLGIGAEIAAMVTEHCFYQLEAPVLRVGGFHIPYPPSRLEDDFLPDLDRVLDAVDRTLAY